MKHEKFYCIHSDINECEDSALSGHCEYGCNNYYGYFECEDPPTTTTTTSTTTTPSTTTEHVASKEENGNEEEEEDYNDEYDEEDGHEHDKPKHEEHQTKPVHSTTEHVTESSTHLEHHTSKSDDIGLYYSEKPFNFGNLIFKLI